MKRTSAYVAALAASGAAHAHWVIDGAPYTDIGAVYRQAVKRGFAGSYDQIVNRLMDGDCTWERLLRPIDKARSAAASRAHKRRRDEMAEVIAALDARKKAMAEGGEE